MISRAMDITGLSAQLGEVEAHGTLAKFADADQAAAWARAGIAECIEAGIISGKNGRLAAEDEITRAEVAVIVQRLLQKSDLID